MKKFSLLIAMLAVAVSAVAQSTLPRPKNPSIDEWIDYQPVIWNDTITGEPVDYQSSSQLGRTASHRTRFRFKGIFSRRSDFNSRNAYKRSETTAS